MKFTLYLKLSLLFLLSAFVSPSVALAEERNELFKTSDSMRVETRWVVNSIERLHYSNRSLEDKDMESFLKRFIEALDFHRMYLTQPDVDLALERFGTTLHSYLGQGNLFPAFRIFKDYRQATLDRIDWISERLEQPFEFSEDLSFKPDRAKLDWPASAEEADELWEGRLKFELLNEIIPLVIEGNSDREEELSAEELPAWTGWEEHIEEAISVVTRRYERWLRFVEDMDANQVQEIFLTTLAQSYDPHSTFLSSDSLEEFSIAMRNSLVGIGAVLTDEDGTCVVRELLPGGPAESSGKINVGDAIIGVAQDKDGEFVDTIDMRLRSVVKMIRGEKGSIVRLLLRPGDASDPSERREVVIVRDEVKLTANLAKARLYQVPSEDRTVSIGVISLPSFYGDGRGSRGESSTTRDVEELIGKLKDLGVEGLVLDFRRNGGGLLSEAISLAGLFLPKGPVVQVRNTLGDIQNYMVGRRQTAIWDGPLIVLVSRFTASASEIVAGALQNHNRAIVVGDSSTHGKGTVQAIFEMNRPLNPGMLRNAGGATKITVQKFYLPNGYSTQNKGVIPDIVLPSSNEFLPIGESDLPNALLWDSIEPYPWDFKTTLTGFTSPLNEWVRETLNQRSQSRQENLEEFDFLTRSIEWIREQREINKVPLNLEKRFVQRQADRKIQEEFRNERENLASLNFDYKEVLLDVSLNEKNASTRTNGNQDMLDSFLYDEDIDGIAASSEDGDESSPRPLDIHLREALRITLDLIELPTVKSSRGELAYKEL